MQYSPFNHRSLSRAVFDPLSITVASAALTAAGTGISAMGTLAGGSAAAQAGQSAQQAALFTAAQQRRAGQESRAAGQRSMFEKQRDETLLQSKLQARAAASGGGATDPGVIDLSQDIAQQGSYQALLEMFKGESKARGYEDAAAGTEVAGATALWEGMAKQKASRLSALGTVIGGAGSAFGQFNRTPARPGAPVYG